MSNNIGPRENGSSPAAANPSLTSSDIRHNMGILIGIDALFTTGLMPVIVAFTPMFIYFGATPKHMGWIQALGMCGLLGQIVSPFISVHFKYKKWYLFLSNVPYIAVWGLMGLGVIFAQTIGVEHRIVLAYLFLLNALGSLFGGFVPLPHQEYTATTIPMSHRGRYSLWAQGIGSVVSIGSTLMSRYILGHLHEPQSFGTLFVLAWLICQGGYVLCLFGRERPTPIENAPTPWSVGMLRALWRDKPFLRLMAVNSVFYIFFTPVLMTFISNFVFDKDGLEMPAKISADLMLLANVLRICLAGPMGWLTDKLHPKRMLPIYALATGLAMLPLLLLRDRTAFDIGFGWFSYQTSWAMIGVFISSGLGSLIIMGLGGAFLGLICGIPKPENRAGHYTIQMIQQTVCFSLGNLVMGYLCLPGWLGFRTTFFAIAILSAVSIPIIMALMTGLSANAADYD